MGDLVGMDRVALSEITFPDATFERHVELAVGVGAAGLGVWADYLAAVGVDRARGLLDEHGLAVANAVPHSNSIFPYGLAPTPTDPAARERAIASQFPDLARLQPEAVILVTGPPPAGMERAAAVDVVQAALTRLGRQADDLGLRLAVEPIHPTAAPMFSMVSSFAGTLELLDGVDAPVGVVVDTWHVHGDDTFAAWLRQHIDRVVGVQVADHRVGATGWADRACPGEGEGTREVLGALLDAGWEGMVDVELFSDDGRFDAPVPGSLWTLPDEELAQRAVALFR